MKRLLIVNADDCNLTPGVTQAILECHDRGILTSTTFMINLPVEPRTVREILQRKKLGVGIHLNLTLGRPVSKSSRVKSLLGPGGTFKKLKDQLAKLPKPQEVAEEYQAQIDRYVKLFRRQPTHLDTHHQVHDHPLFFGVLAKVAARNKLPVRRRAYSGWQRTGLPSARRNDPSTDGMSSDRTRCTDYLFGNLTVEGYWREEALAAILKNLPQGTSEIMCHPGKNDAALRAISSFTTGREAERKLFSSPRLKQLVARLGITLTHFGLCYN